MKTDVNEITVDDFREALEAVMNGKITTIAPLGFSSDHVYLYHNETEGVGHSGCVKVRTWSDMPELLIANKAGCWLSHMKIDRVMGFDYILNEFFQTFEKVKHLIDGFDRKYHENIFAKDAKKKQSDSTF